MAAGIVVGALFSTFDAALAPVRTIVVDGVLNAVGRIFLALLQVIVAPLVLVSLVTGVTSIGDMRALGRVGAKTLLLYLITTAVAIALALSTAVVISPGDGFVLSGDVDYQPRPAPPLGDVLVDMFPTNPVRALADGQMLQIIVFALLLGFAMTLAGAAGKRVAGFFADFNEVMLRMVVVIIKSAPIGVFALLTQTFADQGLAVFRPLAGYFATVVLCLALHLMVSYAVLLRAGGLDPRPFFTKLKAVLSFAFSTSSSSATIPVTLTNVEKRLGVDNSVASFSIPLGATINMDGTAIMQGVAVVFLANVYAVDLGTADYLMVLLTATLASIGTAAVPGAGLIMLALVLTQIGLPLEGIGLIIGIDRLLDMLRTAVNVAGDCAVTCVVARSESALDLDIYNDKDAGLERPPGDGGPRDAVDSA